MGHPRRYGKKKATTSQFSAERVFGSVIESDAATPATTFRPPLADVTTVISNKRADLGISPSDDAALNVLEPLDDIRAIIDPTEHLLSAENLSNEQRCSHTPSTTSDPKRNPAKNSKTVRNSKTRKFSSSLSLTLTAVPASNEDGLEAVLRDLTLYEAGSDTGQPEVSLDQGGKSKESKHEVQSDIESVYNGNTLLPFDPDISIEEELVPLFEAYLTDCGEPLEIQGWEDIFAEGAEVKKLAEASFAEVFKVSTKSGQSILKVIRVKISTDAQSQEMHVASRVDQLLSEVRIMNTMTTVPGFCGFKSAKLVRGKTVEIFTKACKDWITLHSDESQYPGPDSYTDETVCLVIELADAGQVLDEVPVVNTAMLWDVVLGVVIALARGEASNEFEHRDLHENNVCVDWDGTLNTVTDSLSSVKYGNSGCSITLIDYGLSRAQLVNGEVAFFDFEEDKEVFYQPNNGPQFNAYRTMRHHLMTGKREHKPVAWHKDERNTDYDQSWEFHTPYSNVIWIGYILYFCRESFQKHGVDHLGKDSFKEQKVAFNKEIAEFERKLSSRCKRGGFESAAEVLGYAMDEGWVTEEQLYNE